MTIATALLEDRGILRVSGEDAAIFLQGLLTNDVESCAIGEARYAALLSPQGKILFDFLVLRIPAATGAAFLIDCPAAQAGELAKRLGFYRLRAKVAISDESEVYGVVAAWGEDVSMSAAPSVMAGLVPAIHASAAGPISDVSGNGPAWMAGTSPAMTEAGAFSYADPRDRRLGARAIVRRATAAALANAGADAYAAHRIGLGVPSGGVDFAYADIFPHDANLDLLHGVDFKKGCYVGQEVVSRMHHRGEARKRIVRLALAGDAPERGTPVLAGETPIGTMGSASGSLALGLLRIDRAEEARAAGKTLSAGGVALKAEAI